MARLLSLFLLLGSLFTPALSAGPVLQVGDPVPEMCWKDIDDQDFCLNFYALRVRVLIFNTGWCPDCNVEMEELIPRLPEFAEKPVLFLSLSASGFSSSEPPSSEFLKSWKEKHNIPFPVLASPKDPGKKFFDPPYMIPSVAIVGMDNRLFYKANGPDIDTLIDRVNEALRKDVPLDYVRMACRLGERSPVVAR